MSKKVKQTYPSEKTDVKVEAESPAVVANDAAAQGEVAEVIEPIIDTAAQGDGVKTEEDPQPQETPAPAVETPEVIETAPAAADLIAEPVAAPAKKVNENEEEDYLETIRATGTDVQKRILAAIETFESQMKPKAAIPSDKGVGYQYEFLQHLLWLLDKEYEIFRGGWNVLLVYFSVHHGVNTPTNYSALSEYSATRFLQAWTKGAEKADAYRNLITVLRATRNRATRKHDLKTISLEKIAPTVLSAQALDNLKRFYAV